MTIVTHGQALDVSASAAWDVLFDFGGFLEWGGGGRGTIEVDGDDVGMIRKMDIPGIGEIQEKLIERDADSRTLGYQLVGGQPLGMATYTCRVALSQTRERACRIDWHGEFEGADGLDEAEIAESLKGSYVGMSGALAAYAKAR